MEIILYALAVIGILALVAVAWFILSALFSPDEPRHVDPDLLVEMPPHDAPVRRRHTEGGVR